MSVAACEIRASSTVIFVIDTSFGVSLFAGALLIGAHEDSQWSDGKLVFIGRHTNERDPRPASDGC